MAQWNKIQIQLDDGQRAEAQAPVIVSASRSTDIPAFYADWFFHRLEKGYSAWINPFNSVKSYVSYRDTRFIVFWSKNPHPLLRHLDDLKSRGINCYIQYSLNDYAEEGLEPNVPSIEVRISTFKQLVDALGIGHVVWRFDPLVITTEITIDKLLGKIAYIGERLHGYTEKLVFSFVDISTYKKVKKNLDQDDVRYIEWDEKLMTEFASKLSELNRSRRWNYHLATCAESIPLEQYGIEHNRCVDDELMVKLAYKDDVLMHFLGVEIKHVEPTLFGPTSVPKGAIKINDSTYAIRKKNNKDKGQRQFCGCIISKDIGQYNTCPHQCKYCYANASRESAVSNYHQHRLHPLSDLIIG